MPDSPDMTDRQMLVLQIAAIDLLCDRCERAIRDCIDRPKGVEPDSATAALALISLMRETHDAK